MNEIKTIISQIGILCLVSMITLLTLVSCGGGGSDDLGAAPEMAAPQEELVPITFNGYQGNETAETRANSGTPLYASGVTRFHVWGYKNMSYSAGSYGDKQTVFPCYQVDWHANSAATSATNSSNWDYILTEKPNQTIKFWDWSAKAYRFFAATGCDSHEADEPNNTYKINITADASSASAIDAAPYFSRLWFSTGDAGTYPDKQFGRPVTLEFIKPFARVRFIYNYVYPREGVIITSQSFKPSATGEKIYRKGVVTVTYPLEGEDIKESYSLDVTNPSDEAHLEDFTEDYDPDDDTKEYTTCDKGWYTVLPNTSQGSYTLTVNINGVSKTAVVPAEYMKWKPGYNYTYIFKIIDAGGIEIGWVNYAITEWDEMEIDRTVYNW